MVRRADRGGGSARLPLRTLGFLLVLAVVAGGCQHTVSLPVSQVPRLRAAAHDRVVLRDTDGDEVVIRPGTWLTLDFAHSDAGPADSSLATVPRWLRFSGTALLVTRYKTNPHALGVSESRATIPYSRIRDVRARVRDWPATYLGLAILSVVTVAVVLVGVAVATFEPAW